MFPLILPSFLTQAPEVAAKLHPVCKALHIDKDEFAVRRVKASYKRLAGTSDVRTADVFVPGKERRRLCA